MCVVLEGRPGGTLPDNEVPGGARIPVNQHWMNP